ncbi:MAG: hypothetical protein IJ747_06650 [Lachnospiraceae bacterium]|nr:hypothetical protein [Lachnospiraceae bacterium]
MRKLDLLGLLHKNYISREEEERFFIYVHSYALPGIRNGQTGYVYDLQGAFLFRDAMHDQMEIAQCILAELQRSSIRELLRLSDENRIRFRLANRYYTREWNAWYEAMKAVKHKRADFAFLSDQQYVAMLSLGTFHSNGFYREMCMRALCTQSARVYSETYQVPLAPLVFYLLRCNDWVEEIRTLAFELAVKEIECADAMNLVLALPILVKLKDSYRRNQSDLQELTDSLLKRLQAILSEPELERIVQLNDFERNAVYRMFCQNALLSRAQMNRLLTQEKTGYGKRLLFQAIMTYYECSEAELEQYLHSKHADVRYAALQYKFNLRKTAWEGLPAMLLDRSAKIRSMACYILTKQDSCDVRLFYLDNLKKAENDLQQAETSEEIQVCQSRMAVCLLGIGENGDEQDLPVLKPYLARGEVRIVKAALTAYGMIARENTPELYWEYLTQDDVMAAVCAYKQIKKYHVAYDEKRLYQAFCVRKNMPTGRLFLNLLLNSHSWRRLEYLLELCDDQDIPSEARESILNACKKRNMYIRIDQATIDRIKAVLERKKNTLPDAHLAENILFDLKFAET